MKWALHLGKVKGISLYIHWTFLLLIGWVFFVYQSAGQSVGASVQGVFLILLLFGCVLLHELGHAFAARRYGIPTRDITLLPIGGVARLERMPRDPGQELVVALAGPAVNVVIAVVLFLGLFLTHILFGVPLWNSFVTQLMLTNVFLVCFNLLPAFPMDGGRVLRALLARRMPYVRATNRAAVVGQIMAVVFAVVGLLVAKNPLLVLVAAFVFFGARQEAQMVRVTETLHGVTVHDAMMTHFRSLSADSSLSAAAETLLSGAQHDFPVLEGEQLVGVLRRDQLIQALAAQGPSATVRSAMAPAKVVVPEDANLEKSYEMLREDQSSMLPVVREGRLIGLITLENILELLMIHRAMRGEPRVS